ncbi:uncharacterized protein [Arachis hypogaea]|uniref:uncharacterized protein n=1 Tax=Arachis hypogaea TaxID=3818 RepID=UPI003B21F583
MAAMVNLANTMEANAAATLQAVQRLGQPTGNRNGNGEGNADDNVEGSGDNTGGAPMTLATFLKVHPPSFRGSTIPTEADNWFQAMECTLQPQHVPHNQYVKFAAYQLREEAQHWWQAECRLLQLQNVDAPWDVFQTAFYKNYFPESAREGALEAYKSWKCVKYQSGLKDNIRAVMAPIEIQIFSDLVNKARVVEEYAKTKELKMRWRRWMDMLKDYEFELSYHPGKAKVVADALGRKSLTIAWVRIKEEELVDKFVDLKLEIGEVARRACLSQLQISNMFKMDIQRAQQDERKLQKLLQPVGDKRREEFAKEGERVWRDKGRVCTQDVRSLRQDMLSGAHYSGFSVHPGSTKMYCNLKKMFWWSGMKGDVATVASKCLTCQKVKIEHQKPSGMIQPLETPQWKWAMMWFG